MIRKDSGVFDLTLLAKRQRDSFLVENKNIEKGCQEMRILVLTTFKRINSRIVKTLRKKSLLISKGRFPATVVYERTDIKSQQFTTEESKSIVMTTARSWAF